MKIATRATASTHTPTVSTVDIADSTISPLVQTLRVL
jgi:hypothetical protein